MSLPNPTDGVPRNAATFRRLGRGAMIATFLILFALLGRVEWPMALGGAAGVVAAGWAGGEVVDHLERTSLAFLSYLAAVAAYIITLFGVAVIVGAFFDALL